MALQVLLDFENKSRRMNRILKEKTVGSTKKF
jgi:hypothetical protein